MIPNAEQIERWAQDDGGGWVRIPSSSWPELLWVLRKAEEAEGAVERLTAERDEALAELAEVSEQLVKDYEFVTKLEAAEADRDRLAAAAEDAVSEVAEYSEADSPADLPGAVAWLIREDTRSRMRAAAAVADRDRLAAALAAFIDAVETQ